MLNKIWASLIIISILFALGQDIRDEVFNTHNNNQPVTLKYVQSASSNNDITLHYDNIPLTASINTKARLQIHLNDYSPDKLQLIAKANGNPTLLNARILQKDTRVITLIFPEVHWIKLKDITQSAFDMAEFAAKLALGLIGIMALWLGLMKIAESSGMIKLMVKFVQPVLCWLFPNIPKDHPAFASISMNMAANVLGLGNAATPLGIKAMQQLQALNTNKEKASDEMCMFLALNTSSVQLLPPVTLIALMGTQTSELIIPIILATSCSTVVAIIVARYYARRNS